MKIEMDVLELKEAVRFAKALNVKKGGLPILEQTLVKVQAGKTSDVNQVSLVTTNLQTIVEYQMDSACAVETGQVLLPLVQLEKFLPTVATKKVTLVWDVTGVTLHSDESELKIDLGGAQVEEFPNLFFGTMPVCSFDNAAAVKDVLDRISPAVCRDITRDHLCGARFSLSKSALVFEATNGAIFFQYVYPTDGINIGTKLDLAVTIRSSTVDYLRKMLPKKKGMSLVISIDHQDKQPRWLTFTSWNKKVRVSSKLLDERWPRFATVLPRVNDIRVNVSRRGLEVGLRQAAAFSTVARPLTLHWTFSKEHLNLYGHVDDITFNRNLSIGSNLLKTDKQVEVGLGIKWTQAILKSLGATCDEVTIEASHPTWPGGAKEPMQQQPVTFTQEGGAWTCILMPFRMVNWPLPPAGEEEELMEE